MFIIYLYLKVDFKGFFISITCLLAARRYKQQPLQTYVGVLTRAAALKAEGIWSKSLYVF